MINKNKIQDLISIVENSGVSEIEISSFWGLRKLKISKNSSSQVQSQISTPSIITSPGPSDSSMEIPKTEPAKAQPTGHEIKAPLVGTFYSASKPGEPAYVKVGDIISSGQIVCIIEAMKIFNEIESDVSGRITSILVQNEQPVEFDQPLIIVEPV